MKGVWLLVGAVLVAIGIGVGIESAAPAPTHSAARAGAPQRSGVYGLAGGRFTAAFPVPPHLVVLGRKRLLLGAVLEARRPGVDYVVEELPLPATGWSGYAPRTSVSFAIRPGSPAPDFTRVRLSLSVVGSPATVSGWCDASRSNCALETRVVIGRRLAWVSVLGVSQHVAERFLSSLRAVA